MFMSSVLAVVSPEQIRIQTAQDELGHGDATDRGVMFVLLAQGFGLEDQRDRDLLVEVLGGSVFVRHFDGLGRVCVHG